MQPTDAELVEATCRGDLASFRVLYERHYRMAVGVARSRLADAHLAEDAAQEAFAIACRRLDSLKEPARFGEWLGTICRRAATRMSQSRKAHQSIHRAEIAQSPGNDNHAATQRVARAVESLPASAREVIVLHYFSGLAYEDIACALGITPAAVHGRLQRARQELVKHFGEIQ